MESVLAIAVQGPSQLSHSPVTTKTAALLLVELEIASISSGSGSRL